MAAAGLTCIVDDDADYRFLLQQFWGRLFSAYPVRYFSSGQALLDELPRMSPLPRLILLDRHMPGLDGHQTLLVLKQHRVYKRIPVVMMSAHASLFEIGDCFDAGVNSFLLKSLDGESLKLTLSMVCQYWLELDQQARQEEETG